MVRIESYIDAVIEDLKYTLSVLTNFGAEEEKINRIQGFLDIFNSRNVTDIINLIEECPKYFYSTPAAPLLYEVDLANDLIFKQLEEKNYKQNIFSKISLEQFFSDARAKSWLESLSQDDYDSFIEANLTKFENDTLEFLTTILNKYSKPENLLQELYYKHIKEYVINSASLALSLLENLSHYNYYLEKTHYQKLWFNFKNLIVNLSIDNKIEFLKNVHQKVPELMPEVLKSFNVLENVNLYGFSFDDLISYFNDEEKKEIVFSLLADGKRVETAISLLPINIQREILNDQRFLESGLSEYARQLAYDAINPKLFDEYMDTPIMTNDRLLYFFKQTNDRKYLNKLKEIVFNLEQINYSDEWLYDEIFINNLTENEIHNIITRIDYPRSKKDVSDFFSDIMSIKSRTIFVDIIIKNAIAFIELNPGINISIYNSTRTLLSDEEIMTIFENMTPSQQLMKIGSDGRFFRYVAQKIKEDSNFYKGVEIDTGFITIFGDVAEEYKDEIEFIFFNLDECNRDIFFKSQIIKLIPSLVEPYRQYVFSNPPNLSRIFEEFFELDELKAIYEKCPISVYTNALSNSLICREPSFYDNRVDEFIDYINSGQYYFGNWYKHLSDESLNKLLSDVDCFRLLQLLPNLADKKFRKKTIEIIIKEIHSVDFLEVNSGIFQSFIVSLSSEEMNEFISRLDNYGFILLFNKVRSNALEKEFMNKYINGDIELGNSETIILLSKILLTLSPENKQLIESDISKKLDSIMDFNNIKILLKSSVSKLSFIYCVNNDLINKNNEKFVFEMLSKDPFLFDNLDTRLLKRDVLLMGEHFIKKTSRYPIVARKFIDVIDNNPDLYQFMILISQKLNNTEVSFEIYDKKMEIIINYLTEYGIDEIDYENMNDEVLSNIIDYIFQHYRIEKNKNKNDITYGILDSELECDMSCYHKDRNKYLNDKITTIQDLNELRNLFYNRYFWLDYDSVKKFMYSYATNYQDVCEYATSDAPIKYIELIKKIESITDFKTLVDLYNCMPDEYTISDYLNIVGIMTNAYNKANSNIVNSNLSDKKVTKKFVINGKEVEQEVTEATGSYGLFVHSTDAYGSMEMINDDYFESWNYNSNTENHGICCCYITNMSYGTANVKGKGVMFGFNQINEHSIATMAPYDLMTINNGYTITSRRPPLYMRLDKVSSYTRHTHNEFGLERRNETIESEYPCIQPNCIVIFEEMSDEIKANSFKAIEDFKRRGIELDIVYIDRTMNLRNEASIIERGLEEYKHTGDIRILSIIIDRYESNLCGCDFMNDLDVNEELFTERIEEAIQTTIENIKSISDEDVRIAKATEFRLMMEKEQLKFDIIKETVGNRAHKFKLYSDEVKEQIKAICEVSKTNNDLKDVSIRV